MLKINLFGPTTVDTDTSTITAKDLGGVKPRQILEILALSSGTPIAKDRLADMLWDGEPPKTYVGTLESYVCVLRRSLGLTKGRRSVLATTSAGYVLDVAETQVDLVEFRRLLARAAAAEASDSIELTLRALSVASSTLLASEPYTDWATQERNCVQQELVVACSRAAAQALAAGELDAAIQLAAAGIEQDRFAECAVQHLMRALWKSGRRFEALRSYAALRSAMVDELGMEPGNGTYALYMEILADEGQGGATAPGTERTELKTLLNLLRQTLETIPGVQLPRSDGGLAEIAVRVLEVA
jgi:SARP family transcriptional regulator, regulator of embCAB operon